MFFCNKVGEYFDAGVESFGGHDTADGDGDDTPFPCL